MICMPFFRYHDADSEYTKHHWIWFKNKGDRQTWVCGKFAGILGKSVKQFFSLFILINCIFINEQNGERSCKLKNYIF